MSPVCFQKRKKAIVAWARGRDRGLGEAPWPTGKGLDFRVGGGKNRLGEFKAGELLVRRLQ